MITVQPDVARQSNWSEMKSKVTRWAQHRMNKSKLL